MDDLLNIRSAIKDVEKDLKSLRNKMGHRQDQAAKILAVIDGMKREEEALVDRYVALVAEEQKIVRPESAE